MTEVEWLGYTDPGRMLNFLRRRGKLSDRKLLLFAVACCRAVPAYGESASARRGLELIEYEVDGLAPDVDGVERFEEDVPAILGCRRDVWVTVARAISSYISRLLDARGLANTSEEEHPRMVKRAYAGLASLLREVFGNPFRPTATLSPAVLAWNDGTVVKLAQAIYDDRAFDRMPILADALEEAGCTDAEVLAHCRGGGEHVRGCWALDLVMGKE